MGKNVMHTLFILSFLLCKPCAAYFLAKEKNFSCPICKIIKRFKLEEQYSIQLNFNIKKDLVAHSQENKFSFRKTYFYNTSQQKFGCWKKVIFDDLNKSKLENILYSKAYFLKDNSIERYYILFHQLKIGELINSSNLSSSST